jgi:predicted amidohydrolase
MLRDVPGDSDLAVLPEMFTTGFTMEVNDLAETMDGNAVQWMKSQAAKQNIAICGSLIISEGTNVYNRFVLAKPDGSTTHYDKRHLFTMAGEHESFSPGNENKNWDVNGWSIRPQVCYDLRFPVFSRNTDQYHLLLYTANWPEKRIGHWRKLLIARAIENQCYVAAVNRVGRDGKSIAYNGNSMFIDFDGRVIQERMNKSIVLTSTLSISDLLERRKQFPVLDDQDQFDLS